MSWRALGGAGESSAFNAGYLGVDPNVARRALARIEAPERYSFVDLGCGKGRALIVASEFGFHEILGLELSPALTADAVLNIAKVRAAHPDRAPMHAIRADAASFTPPPGPFVVFLYHPFEAPVMRRVVKAISASLAAAPREAVVVYVNARLARLFDAAPALERVDPADHEPPSAARALLWRTKTPLARISRG